MSSVITFINNLDEESGKTMSLVAIATYMAINYNEKILVISTTNKEDKIKSCYFEEQQVKKLRLGLFGDKTSTIDTESGIEGIAKMVRSNKLTPEVITNYTRVVFKDRLEIILGYQPKEEKQADIDVTEIDEEFICENCGKKVTKLGYSCRNHCPYCLHSKHIDINPGDRQEECHGDLEPVGIDIDSKKGYVIVFKCKKCGKIRRNKAAKDDNMDLIIKLSAKQY